MADTRTARQLVTASLKRLGVIAGIETPTADLLVDGLDRLQDIVATWATESLMLYGQGNLYQNPLIPQVSYSVGPGGDIDVDPRPPWLDLVSLLHPGPPAWETLLTPLTREAWDLETQKVQTSSLPSAFWYNPSWPLGNVALWPVLSDTSQVAVLRLYVPGPLPSVFTLDTVLSLPQGYFRALRDTLAIELAPEVGRPVDPVLVKVATETKAQLERANWRIQVRTLARPAALGAGCGGGYNWLTDE
jgi:hypothetical protein